MSIQQNFPAITPSLSLNFARSKKLDPRITFTRTSSATRINETGLVEVVPANAPRFDHSYDPVSGSVRSLGLLVEESRTNLLLRSEEFDNVAWSKLQASITANTIVAPDGTLTGDKLVEDTTPTSTHEVDQGSISFVSGTVYTFSVYAKAAERSSLRLAFLSTAFGTPVSYNYNLSAGTFALITSGTSNSASIQLIGDGWYRCSITAQATSTISASVKILLVSGTVTAVYTGDGTSGIYIWGAQLEAGAFPTSYIPTTTSTVTRTADNASITGSNFSDWYRQDEGTLNLSYRLGQKISDSRALELYNDLTPNQNRISIVSGTAASIGGYLFVVSNGVPQGQGPTVSNIGLENSIFKVSASYKLNDLAATNNRTPTFFTDDIAELPVGVNSLIFSEYTTGRKLCGHIQYFSYYPSRLPNDQLITLTK
jgi:hypothetical protein